jgi:hypothetical protein
LDWHLLVDGCLVLRYFEERFPILKDDTSSFGIIGILFLPPGRGLYVMFLTAAGKQIAMKIYVGNLSYRTAEEDLRQEFERFGTVDSVDIIFDRETNRSKGFGFVEMSNNDQANEAIAALDGQNFGDRTLKVNEARPKAPRPSGGGYGGGGGGGRPRGDRERRY